MSRHARARSALVALLSAATLLSACTGPPPHAGRGGSWPMSGYDPTNSRFNPQEKAISAATVNRLEPRWSLDTKGDVSATPSVQRGIVYFPDWGGYLNAVEAATGRQLWQRKLSEFTGDPQSYSKSTPAFFGDLLIIGDSKAHTHAEEPPPPPAPTTTTTTTTAPAAVVALAEPGDDHGDHDHSGPGTSTPGVTTPGTTAPGTTAPGTTMPGGDHHGDGDDHGHGNDEPEGGPAHVMAIDRHSGRLVWKTDVDAHPWSQVTSQPVVVGHRIVVGVSSSEETVAESGDYPCCSFRGSIISLDGHSGRILWKTYTVPPNPEGKTCGVFDPAAESFAGCAISGAAVWNTPAVDVRKHTAYFATGNNYTVTDAEYECAKLARAENRPDGTCTREDNHIESIIAVDLATGRMKWSRKLGAFDAWNSQCVRSPGVTWCPSPFGRDYDFGSNTNLFTATIDGVARDLVGVGQKSGIYWVLDARTGEQVWNTLVGPGSALGGIQWGSAYDGTRIYTGNGNLFRRPHTLQPSGATHNGGTWTAMDPATGAIIWQTPAVGAFPNAAMGPVTVAGDVVFGGSTSPRGDNMFAMDAATGAIKWSFPAAGSVMGGPAVVDGMVFWGAGYEHNANVGTTSARKLYAFGLRAPDPGTTVN